MDNPSSSSKDWSSTPSAQLLSNKTSIGKTR